MELSSNQQKFLEHCEEARKIAFSFRKPIIVHHHDADGVSSGAIAASAFQKANRKYKIKCIKTLDDKAIDELLKDKEKEIIFTDLGSGNERVNELKDVVIIDHHQPAKVEKFQANCMLFGMDGGRELSSSSTAYLVFREHVDLGIVGAIGDLQAPFTSLNRYMVEEGEGKKEVKVENDLCFYGRFSRALIPFLLYGDEIYIAGFSYREDRITQFLNDLKIPLKTNKKNDEANEADGHWRTYADLSNDEKRKLISGLADMLISQGRIASISQLIDESYIFPSHPKNETYEAGEFSTLLNACGRNSRADIGLRVCLGDETAYTEAAALLQMHRKNIRAGIEYAQGHVQDFGAFYVLDARKIIDESIIGIICGMWLKATAQKPIFGISSSDENKIKISGRANGLLLKKGINIGLALRAVAQACEGIGGGHKPAGGATLPEKNLNEFLVELGNKLANVQ